MRVENYAFSIHDCTIAHIMSPFSLIASMFDNFDDNNNYLIIFQPRWVHKYNIYGITKYGDDMAW